MRPPTLLYFKVTLTIWDTLRFQMNFSCQPNFLSSLCLKMYSLSHAQLLQLCGLYSPWNSPGQNTGMGSLFLLQGIFPTQGSNSGLLNYRQILYQLSHKGSPEGGIFNWEMTVFSLDTNFPAIATVFHSHFKYTGQESLSTDRCVELRELVL